jgi:ATP-dependent NAD(P)H-hydrate dehydratase
MPLPRSIIGSVKDLIPPLDGHLHKGQSGKVAILGGARDYTGAPFFAAYTALRIGADLSHVICSPTAAPAIKSYSPDLIVHPILIKNDTEAASNIGSILDRIHVLVVGPGLGRERYMQDYANLAVRLARIREMYILLDADALLPSEPILESICGYRRTVLTPNLNEFGRLLEWLKIDPNSREDEKALLVSKGLGGVTVLQKGANDIIAGGDPQATEVLKVDTPGGLKRCGGQGDILSGAVGTFLAWGKCYEDGVFGHVQP